MRLTKTGANSAQIGLIAAAAMFATSASGTESARGPADCTRALLTAYSAPAARAAGFGLLAAARQASLATSYDRPADHLEDGTEPRTAGTDGDLSTAALRERVARYRVGPTRLDLQTVASSDPPATAHFSRCERDG